MGNKTCEVEVQENLFNGRGVNWEHFVNLMECAADNNISIYTSTADALVSMGKLSRESGFAVYAHGILSRNPREAANYGNQLYFASKPDAMVYSKELVKSGKLDDCCYTIEDVKERRV